MVLFFILIRDLYQFVILYFRDSLEISKMDIFRNFTLFIILRVGHYIFPFPQHLDRELVNVSREDWHKIMIEIVDIVLI